VFGGLATTALWHLSSIFRPCDFAVLYRPGRPVRVRGRIAKAKVPAIAGFFSRDLNPGRAVMVRGIRRGKELRLQISGGLSPEAKQRVRNFLMEHLR